MKPSGWTGLQTLYNKLREYKEGNRYPFHMPGHKGHFFTDDPLLNDIAGIDITEIAGFDDLHHAEGIIEAEQERTAALFGVKKSHILVGGSSSGILAAICSQTDPGDPVLVDRGGHRSVYHALYLNDLRSSYLNRIPLPYPFTGGIDPSDVERMMDECRARVVCITSPTYEGVVSDIKAIAKTVHDKNGILIVDEAHGAHLHFLSEYSGNGEGIDDTDDKRSWPAFPESAAGLGADIVIQSLHKTLPAFTQTAVLHICSDRADLRKLELHLKIHQSSSPSYILMASVSRCLDILEDPVQMKKRYFERLSDFYEKARRLDNLRVFMPSDNRLLFDPSKIVILTEGLYKDKKPYGGRELSDELLSEYDIDLEMARPFHALAMTSVMDTKEGFERLEKALSDIDKRLENDGSADYRSEDNLCKKRQYMYKTGTAKMTIRSGINAESEAVNLQDAPGRICGEFIYAYPPGIPLLVPGEVIEKEAVEMIRESEDRGISYQREGEGIRCCKQC